MLQSEEASKQTLRFGNLLLVLLPLFFVLTFLIADSHSIISDPFRVIFGIGGPLVVFLTYLVLGLKFFNIRFDDKLKTIMGYGIILGILGVFVALTLNTRGYLLISVLYGVEAIDLDTAQLLIFAVLVPIVEEFVKVFAVIVFARHLQSRDDSTYLKNPKVFILLAIIGGSIFNLLETYNYTWSVAEVFTSYFFDRVWDTVRYQLILRSINPLHITTAMISSLGIIQAIQQTPEGHLSRNNITGFLPYFLLAIVIHALWNGYLVLYPEVPTYNQLPLFNWVLLGICIIIFISIFYYYSVLSFPVCPTCNNWHYDSITHFETPQLVSVERSSVFMYYTCKSCDVEFNESSCPNCGTIEVFSCSNCQYPLPIYARECWKCEFEVEPFYDSLDKPKEKSSLLLIQGFYSFVAIYYILQILLLFTSDLFANNFNNIPNVIIIYLIVSMGFGIGLYLNFSEKYKVWGMVIGRYIAGLVLISVILLFSIFISLFLTSQLIIAPLFLLIFMILFGILAFKLLIPPIIFVRSEDV